MRGADFLNRRVVTNGIKLGRVVDVILDESGERPLGLDVRCGDGSHRFLAFTVAEVDGEDVRVGSPLVLLEPARLDFYRERGQALRSAG